MCGIAGVMNRRADLPPPDLDQLGVMAGALRHRGPDEFGLYRDRRAGLAHARLSIIDLATGQQPLTSERGVLWIAFNGEIFNYVELRDELVLRGHAFNTRSDTEVIVHAYEEWGADAFRRFNGQWAVGLWDSGRNELVLARDPFGVRPLYVAEHDGRVLFASEVKALFAADPTLPRRLDPVGLDQLFTFWSPVAPQTVFEGIQEIEPGTVRVYTSTGIRHYRSYEPGFPMGEVGRFSGTLDDAVDEVREALSEATSLRMLRADVPVGSYLSGGLDSSLTAAMGLRAKGSKFSTFSLRFEDAEYDETSFQRTMAERLGSEHHEVVVSRGDIARVFPDVVWHTERPVLRTAPAPLFLLSKLVHDSGIKVVLTGEGADEMFAGYDLFREAKIRRFWGAQPKSEWRPRLLDRLYPYLERSPVAQRAVARQFFGRGLERRFAPGFGHDPRWNSTGALKRLFSPELRERVAKVDSRGALLARLPAEFSRWTPLAQDQYLEVHTLLSGYLLSSQGDRMLMAHSVEGRFPFLDRRVAALAESLPPAYKLRVLDEKHVLKRAAADLLPASILERPKQPYRAPDALSFATPEAQEWMAEVAGPEAVKDAGCFDPGAVQQLLAKCASRAASGQFSNADNMGVVGVLSTQLVHERFIRRRPEAIAPAAIRTVVDRVSTEVSAS
ncbi:MAG: asparagine synthase (glutamine-hydrolyzing) [Acidobacteria bacterium]|nr:asparagine synthase (glutamine-hydrolyzing) [Acidobacteriota bacterium]